MTKEFLGVLVTVYFVIGFCMAIYSLVKGRILLKGIPQPQVVVGGIFSILFWPFVLGLSYLQSRRK